VTGMPKSAAITPITVYGTIVTVAGVADSSAALAKARGVYINLRVGLAMLALGVLLFIWQWLRPAQPGRSAEDRQTGRPS
jgi:hypothetical protein